MQSAVDGMESQDPKTFGKYTILRKLGQGGMGTVFEAEHQHLHKRVALKVMHASVAEKPGGSERFLREGRAAAKLHHPNVVDVTDVGVQDGTLYLVMELLSGEDLAARIQREKTLTITDAIDLMLPVCAAVYTMHAHGLVHRDLKPENIFLARAPGAATTPKILDFGVCRVEDPRDANALSTTGGLVGTPNYMAPEQVTGRRSDARSDQHALAVILYELVCGRRPYAGDTMLELLSNIAEGRFRPPSELRRELPRALSLAIVRALAPAPEDRFSDVRALGEALVPFASDRGRGFWSDAFEAAPSGSAARFTVEHSATLADAAEGRMVTDLPAEQTLSGSETPVPENRSPKRRASPSSRAALAAALVAALSVVSLSLASRRNTAAPTATTVSAAQPAIERAPVRPEPATAADSPLVAPSQTAQSTATLDAGAARMARVRSAAPTTPRTPNNASARNTSSAGNATNAPSTNSGAPVRPVVNGAPIVD